MLVFIDESGDAGFKITKGSSRYFVIVLIIFDDPLDAEEVALKIKQLRKKLKKTDNFEFKFNKCDRKIRKRFLFEIKDSNFRVRAIVFNKQIVYSHHLRTKKESFYSFALRMVLDKNNDTIKNARIRIDGSGEKAFRKELTIYLRTYLNLATKKVMRNLRFRDSRKDVLIQLADMIAGAVRRSYDKDKSDYEIYRKIIKKKEEDVWEFE